MRYGNVTHEYLRRLEKLSTYYYKQNLIPKVEVLKAEIVISEQLSKKLVLPVKVRGRFLREGRPMRRYYTKEELKKSVNNPINKRFPLMLDHRDMEASTIIGVVTKILYDNNDGSIKWSGHINDETFARNVLDEIINEVSVTVYSGVEEFDESLGIVGKDLTYKELSLVMKGAVKGNFIEAY